MKVINYYQKDVKPLLEIHAPGSTQGVPKSTSVIDNDKHFMILEIHSSCTVEIINKAMNDYELDQNKRFYRLKSGEVNHRG